MPTSPLVTSPVNVVSPDAIDNVVAKIRAQHRQVFDPASPAAPSPVVGEGRAADAIRTAETSLAQQHSVSAQLDLQVITAVLNAHTTHAAGTAGSRRPSGRYRDSRRHPHRSRHPGGSSRLSALSHRKVARYQDGGGNRGPGRHLQGIAGGRPGIAVRGRHPPRPRANTHRPRSRRRRPPRVSRRPPTSRPSGPIRSTTSCCPTISPRSRRTRVRPANRCPRR